MSTPSIAPSKPNEEALEGLVHRTRQGDEKAWQALWSALEPLVEGVAWRRQASSRLSTCPEARSDVVNRVMKGLREDDYRRLAVLGERLARRDGSFRPWLSKIAHDAAVDAVRAHPDYLGRKAKGWVSRAPLPEDVHDERAPDSRRTEARLLLARCPEVLAPAQLDALGEWLVGDDPVEIAATLHLAGGAREATRLVRSAVARLRRLTAPRHGDAGPQEIDQGPVTDRPKEPGI